MDATTVEFAVKTGLFCVVACVAAAAILLVCRYWPAPQEILRELFGSLADDVTDESEPADDQRSLPPLTPPVGTQTSIKSRGLHALALLDATGHAGRKVLSTQQTMTFDDGAQVQQRYEITETKPPVPQEALAEPAPAAVPVTVAPVLPEPAPAAV